MECRASTMPVKERTSVEAMFKLEGIKLYKVVAYRLINAYKESNAVCT